MMCFNNFTIRRAVWVGLMAGLIGGCGGGDSTPATPSSPTTLTNVIPVTVDLGPTGNDVNQLFATVTLCQPGSTSQCLTIDHMVIDTGSTGVRVFSTAIPPSMNLPRLTGAGGFPLLNCVQFVDNTYVWGPMAKADVVLGAKTAAGLPIQIMADPAYNALAGPCSSSGSATAITSAAALGANGILGLGLFKEDCGSWCATQPNNGVYFTCTNAACTAVVASTASTAQQVKHPVPLFASDNNGVLIDLPAVSSAGAANLRGSLIFGIGTESNNSLHRVQCSRQTQTAISRPNLRGAC